MYKFSKNERRACDHQVWLLERPQAPLADLTTKPGATASLEIQWTRIENRKILDLPRIPLCGQIDQESFQSLEKPNL